MDSFWLQNWINLVFDRLIKIFLKEMVVFYSQTFITHAVKAR